MTAKEQKKTNSTVATKQRHATPTKTRHATPPRTKPAPGKSRNVTPPKTRHATPTKTRHATPPRTKPAPAKSSSLEGIMAKVVDDLVGTTYADTPEFEAAVKKCIPSEFLLIASQDDNTQAQEDYYAIDHFKLGKHVPKYVEKSNAGSVATCALLQLMYENPKLVVAENLKPGEEPINCLQLSKEIKKRVKDCSKLDAHPTISSSRPLGPARVDQAPPFFIVPRGFTGTRRALLIGVVKGEGADLKGPPNDVTNFQQFLTKHCGFKPENVTVLQDYYKSNGGKKSNISTKENITKGFEKLIKDSKPGDVCFIQFSGHGGRVGNNLYILPSDYDKAGPIMDEFLLVNLIKKLPGGVACTMLVDCCYSGTVGDLPYILQHNTRGKQEIDSSYDTDTRKEMIKKEKEGGEKYQLYKQARSQKRITNRVGDITDFVAASAMAGYDATAWAAHAGYDITAKMAKDAYDATAKVAHAGYDIVHSGYDATAKTAADAAAYTSKIAGDASHKTSALLRGTSQGATDASKSAAHSITESGTAVVGATKFGFSSLANAATSAAHAATEAAKKTANSASSLTKH